MNDDSAAADTAMNPSYPPKPDRSGYNRVKRKYKALQLKYTDVHQDRVTLKQQLGAASTKASKLQTEINLLLDQLAQVTPQSAEVNLEEEVDGGNETQLELDNSAGAQDNVVDGTEPANASAAPLTEHPKRPREGEDETAAEDYKRPRLDSNLEAGGDAGQESR